MKVVRNSVIIGSCYDFNTWPMKETMRNMNVFAMQRGHFFSINPNTRGHRVHFAYTCPTLVRPVP